MKITPSVQHIREPYFSGFNVLSSEMLNFLFFFLPDQESRMRVYLLFFVVLFFPGVIVLALWS